VYCLYRGAAKVFRTARDGREQIVRLASAGDLVGYRSVFDGQIHSTCATALDEVQACFIPRAQFALLCENAPTLAHAMLGLLSHQLVAVEERMLELTQKSVRERLAETLLQLHAIFGVERDGTTLDVRLSRGELAELVGAATESVIRFLTDFKRAGVLSLRGKRIGILELETLHDVANVEIHGTVPQRQESDEDREPVCAEAA
jgi:CRP/FNR family transcriptional regulator